MSDPVTLSQHAVDRYHERVRPGLTLEQARDDLEALIRVGIITNQQPAWLGHVGPYHATLYLIVGDIVLPLASTDGHLTATTCIPRGTVSAATRADRNQHRAHHHPKDHDHQPYHRHPHVTIDTPTSEDYK